MPPRCFAHFLADRRAAGATVPRVLADDGGADPLDTPRVSFGVAGLGDSVEWRGCLSLPTLHEETQ
jgi:hypothetical protein